MQLKNFSCFLGVLISLSSFIAIAFDDYLVDMELVDNLDGYDHLSPASPRDTLESENINIYLSLQIYLSQKEPPSSAKEHEAVPPPADQIKIKLPVNDKMLTEKNAPDKSNSKKKDKKDPKKNHNTSSSGVRKEHRTRWTKQEDDKLMRIIKKQKKSLTEGEKINWQKVTEKFLKKSQGKRTSKQLRERFINHLDNVFKGPLDDALKNQILQLQGEMGCSWSAIAKIINQNRSSERITPLYIKNFYYSYISRAKKYGDTDYEKRSHKS